MLPPNLGACSAPASPTAGRNWLLQPDDGASAGLADRCHPPATLRNGGVASRSRGSLALRLLRRLFHAARDSVPNRLLNRICGCQEVFVLPEPQNNPPLCAQSVVGVGVAGLVASELPLPPGAVVLGLSAVLRAPVPEAAVYKNRHLGPREQYVCPPACDARKRGVHPVAQTPSVEFPANSHLGSRVPPRVVGHPVGQPRVHLRCPREGRHKWHLFAIFFWQGTCPRVVGFPGPVRWPREITAETPKKSSV